VRKLWRIIGKAIAMLSLLLCVVTVGLWASSYRYAAEITYDNDSRFSGDSSARVSSRSGSFFFECWAWRQLKSGGVIHASRSESTGIDATPVPGEPGIRWARGFPGLAVRISNGGTQTVPGPFYVRWPPYLIVAIRYWLLIGLILLYPVIWWLRHRRAERDEINRCACGYDLRATPKRCPECGAIPTCVG
jgi:hypothetical protein